MRLASRVFLRAFCSLNLSRYSYSDISRQKKGPQIRIHPQYPQWSFPNLHRLATQYLAQPILRYPHSLRDHALTAPIYSRPQRFCQRAFHRNPPCRVVRKCYREHYSAIAKESQAFIRKKLFILYRCGAKCAIMKEAAR